MNVGRDGKGLSPMNIAIKKPFRLFDLFSALLASLAGHGTCQEQAGYSYGAPENPLIIDRPDDPIESGSDNRPQGQPAPKEGGGGGGGHGHHHDSDDPLAWLRESIPGKKVKGSVQNGN